MPDALTLTLKLEREDNPLLYDDLRNVPKGIRRTNRLRTLATNGLNSELVAKPRLVPVLQPAAAAQEGGSDPPEDVGPQAAAEVFCIAKGEGAS